jgi:MFS family permease
LAARAGAGRHVVRALRHRNYQLFFVGQGISLMGTWMQAMASGWLVRFLVVSPFYQGLVGFCAQIPAFMFSPLAGVLADHMDRRRLVIATQALAMVQALVLAALALTGTITIWYIVAMSLVLGVVNAFDVPIRQSFVVEMVPDKSDISNAIALNSSLFNSARLVGPAVAGAIIATFGEKLIGAGVCFALNGLSYIAVIFSLRAMKLNRSNRAAPQISLLANVKAGLDYAMGFAPLKAILQQVATMSLVGMSYAVLMPTWAKDILHGGARTQGFLLSSAGCGALVGAIYLASRRSVRGLGRLMAIAAFLFGSALIGFSFSRILPLSMVLLGLAGFGAMISMASSNSLIQTLVDDKMRGRVMSLYTLCFMGTVPFGSLLAGAVASWLGAPFALAIGGAGCIVAAFLFARKLPHLGRMVHPIYVQLGLAPQASEGAAIKQRL